VSTTAHLFIDELPQFGDGCKRYLVDFKWASTHLFYMPGGPIDLSEQHRISVLLQRHEEECGRCNTARLWRQHGDPHLKAAVDGLWEQMGLSTPAERRN
jgi:hypothetical protein